MNVVSFGEVLWDIIEEKEYLGGAPLNFSVHLANLAVNSYIITRVGEDQRGKLAIEGIKDNGVYSNFIQTDGKHPTGIANVTLNEGIPSYEFLDDAAYQFIEMNADVINQLHNMTVNTICFGTLVQRGERTRASLYRLLDEVKFENVYFDVNIRFDFHPDAVIEKSLSYTNILKVNDDEVEILSKQLFGTALTQEEFARKVAEKYDIKIVLVTLGPGGVGVFADGEYFKIPSMNVPVVSTVGAGDSFGAGFLAAYDKTKDAVKSAQFGIEVASYVITQTGATPKYPDWLKLPE